MAWYAAGRQKQKDAIKMKQIKRKNGRKGEKALGKNEI